MFSFTIVGAQCGGTVDLANSSGGFGGLFACVFGGDTRQGRPPASWDTLVVALIKLVCRLIQTPLPEVCIHMCSIYSFSKYLVPDKINFSSLLYFQTSAGRSDSTMRVDSCETSLNLAGDITDTQMNVNISQTDESKVAEQQSSRLQQCASNKPRVRCVADTGTCETVAVVLLIKY